MRVPDYLSTAGYAASSAVEVDNDDNRNNPFMVTLNENSKNKLTSNQNRITETNFISNADAFVQRALKSSSYEAAANEHQHQEIDGNSTALEQNLISNRVNSVENTYRSFKDIFVANKTFYENYGRDFSNLNTLEREENNTFEVDRNNVFQSNCENYENWEPQHEMFKSPIKKSLDETISDDNSIITESVKLATNNRSTTISDKKPPSPTSSCESLGANQFLYFPRGIINPNYPGFHRFAHTLSEHYFGLSSEYNDSDMSENDFESSGESSDEIYKYKITDDIEMSYNNHNNNNHNNNNNNLIMETNNQAHNAQNNASSLADKNSNNNSDFDWLPSRIKTKLHLSKHSTHDYPNLKMCDQPMYADAMMSSLSDNPSTTTPDILIKTNQMGLVLKNISHPDLLHGVSPLMPTQNDTSIYDADKLQPAVNKDSNKRDEVLFSTTPVDIIGDFGEEVEREFGLLVPGYKKFTVFDAENVGSEKYIPNIASKLYDANLSNAFDKINSAICLDTPTIKNDSLKCDITMPKFEFICEKEKFSESECMEDSKTCEESYNEKMSPTEKIHKPKYQKPSHDERQLPPIVIDYKRCQQSQRTIKKRSEKIETNRNSYVKRCYSLASSSKHKDKLLMRDTPKMDDESEINNYQQLISDKELILSNSRYATLSSWAQYLKNSVKDGKNKDCNEFISSSALELFDAYKIGTDIDVKTLQNHMKMAKEIERRRRNDREEIRRRLAMGPEQKSTEASDYCKRKSRIQSWLLEGANLNKNFDASSDTESHSSDSETCPKLSKASQQTAAAAHVFEYDTSTHPYNGRPLTYVPSKNKKNDLKLQQNIQKPKTVYSDKAEECDFFTKQTKLQLEARMALAQAKDMAHMQMQIDRQRKHTSPITEIIRSSLNNVGVVMGADKRRVSRQMLTEMNIAQLQLIVNSLHSHIAQLNGTLVDFLMERDDLHVGQDAILVDIEELTRYIGSKENGTKENNIKVVA